MSYSIVFSAIFLFSAVLMRPTLFGQTTTSAGLLLMALVSLSFIMIKRPRFQLRKSNLWMLILTSWLLAFWLYCLAGALTSGDSNNEFVIKSVATGIFTSFVFLLFLTDRLINHSVFLYFAVVNSLLGWSIVVSQILLSFLPYYTLAYFNIPVEGYEHVNRNGDVLFPFSLVYGELSAYGLHRFLGIYRESGICQMFFVWSGAYLFFSRKHFALIIGPILGGLLLAATSYFLSILAVFVGYAILEKRLKFAYTALILMLTFVSVWLMLYLPGFGLADKLSTHASSIDDRLFTTTLIWSDIGSYIFGKGMHHKYAPFENMGINALSSAYYIGFVGVALYLSLFFVRQTVGGEGSQARYTILLLPLLVTSITSQPLIEAPLAFMLLFCVPPSDQVQIQGSQLRAHRI